jgi:hypothetical protein
MMPIGGDVGTCAENLASARWNPVTWAVLILAVGCTALSTLTFRVCQRSLQGSGTIVRANSGACPP